MTSTFLGSPPIGIRQWIERKNKTFVKYTDASEREDFFDIVRSVSEIPHLEDAEIVRHGTSITSIGRDAFNGRTNLTTVTIPDSVTSIGNSAFRGCSGLTSVTIPDSITSIGSSAFMSCTNLTSVTIPDSVTSIGEEAFTNISQESTFTNQSCETIGSWFGKNVFGYPDLDKEYTILCTDGTLRAIGFYDFESGDSEWVITYDE